MGKLLHINLPNNWKRCLVRLSKSNKLRTKPGMLAGKYPSIKHLLEPLTAVLAVSWNSTGQIVSQTAHLQLGTRRHFKNLKTAQNSLDKGQVWPISSEKTSLSSHVQPTILQVMDVGTSPPTFFFSNTFNFHLPQKKRCHNNENWAQM